MALPVSKPLTSKSVRLLQPKNIRLISLDCAVLKWDRSSLVSELQPENISCTRLSSYGPLIMYSPKLLISRSVRLLQSWNMPAMPPTFSVVKLLKSRLSRLRQFLNMFCIFVTLPVSKLLRSRLDRAIQPKNISSIFVTFPVLKSFRFKSVRERQPENNSLILVILLVSNSLRSRLLRLTQFLKIPPMFSALPRSFNDCKAVHELNRLWIS